MINLKQFALGAALLVDPSSLNAQEFKQGMNWRDVISNGVKYVSKAGKEKMIHGELFQGKFTLVKISSGNNFTVTPDLGAIQRILSSNPEIKVCLFHTHHDIVLSVKYPNTPPSIQDLAAITSIREILGKDKNRLIEGALTSKGIWYFENIEITPDRLELAMIKFIKDFETHIRSSFNSADIVDKVRKNYRYFMSVQRNFEYESGLQSIVEEISELNYETSVNKIVTNLEYLFSSKNGEQLASDYLKAFGFNFELKVISIHVALANRQLKMVKDLNNEIGKMASGKGDMDKLLKLYGLNGFNVRFVNKEDLENEPDCAGVQK